MQDVHLSGLDLNLLRVFDALAEERSVTRAGARLGLSQSAVSHALGRLRLMLDDPLFVRGPDGMRPTARALEIAPRLRQGLAQLQEALSPTAFNPAATNRRFVIAAGAYAGAILMPEVLSLVRAEAPAAELRVHTVERTLGEDLESGRVDLAIGAFGRASPRFDREGLFEERAVWVTSARNAAARHDVLSLAALADLPLVLMAGPQDRAIDGRVVEGGLERWVIWDDRGALDEALAEIGRTKSLVLTVQDAQSALAIVSRTDMAALAPRRLATAFAQQYDLKVFDPPYRSPAVEIEALWRKDLGPSPAIDWLRARLRSAAARL
ncbi:MAG TPA: LysR family transcriptional regulator [Caulobacteraceae bacterium]|nr:LysR family transcriptional regulator [Caulobacteraceae bacterium]